MQSHRLARLLRIIALIRTHPLQTPAGIAEMLGISVRQLYYDKNDLAKMGFRFSRSKGRFAIHKDPVVTIHSLPLSEILALVLATRHLFETNDFPIVHRAIKGLYSLVGYMPNAARGLLHSLIDDVIIREGCGCSPEIFDQIVQAVEEKRRIVVHFRHGAPQKQIIIDPFQICLKHSKLYLDAYGIEKKRRSKYRMATMDKVIFTPFFRPEYEEKT